MEPAGDFNPAYPSLLLKIGQRLSKEKIKQIAFYYDIPGSYVIDTAVALFDALKTLDWLANNEVKLKEFGVILTTIGEKRMENWIDNFLSSQRQAEVLYKMTAQPRGLCVIINNEKFKSRSFREGSHFDVAALKKTFKWLGFDVHYDETKFKDKKGDEIVTIAEEYATTIDHSGYSAFVFCILSHGCKGCVRGVDDELVGINYLRKMFSSCKGLRGKPKMFIIQACQTPNKNSALQHDGDGCTRWFCEDIPDDADSVAWISSTPGERSWRYKSTGSLLITLACEALQNFAGSKHESGIFIEANKKVAKWCDLNSRDEHVKVSFERWGSLRENWHLSPNMSYEEFLLQNVHISEA